MNHLQAICHQEDARSGTVKTLGQGRTGPVAGTCRETDQRPQSKCADVNDGLQRVRASGRQRGTFFCANHEREVLGYF